LELRRSAEPAKAAGIAPRLEPEGGGEGLRPQPRPETGFFEEASSSEKGLRERGEAFGRSGDPKGIAQRLRLRAVPRKTAGFGPAFFERATGEASASMRALETARLQPVRIRQGSGGISIPPSDPNGNRRGA
jgi:hypothetical protein